jgi:cysteine desulfurase
MKYFDYNASAPVLESIRSDIIKAITSLGNPSSIHKFGRDRKRSLDGARKTLANYFNVLPQEVFFTSGATESNNVVISSFEGTVIHSSIEHDSIAHARSNAIICPVLKNGMINTEALCNIMEKVEGNFLVSLIAAQNETGIIQPIEEIKKLVKESGGFFHTDATQAIGRTNINFNNCDYISLSAHKIGGISGIGCLIAKDISKLTPLIVGGMQERSFRAGTENVIGAIAFGAAIDRLSVSKWSQIEHLRNLLEEKIQNICPDSYIVGKDLKRLPNTSLISMPNVKSEIQVIAFDLEGFMVSAGSACSSGKIHKSRILEAMELENKYASTTIRISLTLETEEEDIEKFVEIWRNLYERFN